MEILRKGVLPPEKPLVHYLGTCHSCGCMVKLREDDEALELYEEFEVSCPTQGCPFTIYLDEMEEGVVQ